MRRLLAWGIRLLAGAFLLFTAIEVAGWMGSSQGQDPPTLSQKLPTGGGSAFRVLREVLSPDATVTGGDGQSRAVWVVTLGALATSLPGLGAACLAVLGFGIPLGVVLGRYRWLRWLGLFPWLLTWVPVAWIGCGLLWWLVDRWHLPMLDFASGESNRNLEHWRGLLVSVLTVLPALGWQIVVLSREISDGTSSGWIEWGRLRGQSKGRVFHRHVIRHAAAPMLFTLAETLPSMVGGMAIAEWVLGYPGYGWLVVEAARQRQIVVLCAAVLAGLLIMISVRTLAEIIRGLVDPRVRERRDFHQDRFL